MPKSGKHKLPRGLLGKQDHFNMASTLTCEISIRNHFGIGEITLFLILCPLNEGKGPGCDNIVTNELHLPVLHFAKENKEEKWCSSYFRGTKLRWAASKSNNRSPTSFLPKSDPVTKAEAAVMSQHVRNHPWCKLWQWPVSRDRNSDLGEIRLARSDLSWKCVAGSSQTEHNPQKPFDSLAQRTKN